VDRRDERWKWVLAGMVLAAHGGHNVKATQEEL
jgi:hypothetical protein